MHPDETPDESPYEEDKLFYRRILHDMIHAGVGLVRSLELRAVNGTMDGTDAAIEAAAAYERVTRALRRNIMLATKLAEPEPKPEPTQPAPEPEAPPAPRARRAPREHLADPPEQPDEDEPTDADEPPLDQPRFETPEPPDPQDRPEHIEDDSILHWPVPEQIASIHRDLVLSDPHPVPDRRPWG